MREHLAERRALAVKVARRAQADGSEFFIVVFPEPVLDLRDGREKKST